MKIFRIFLVCAMILTFISCNQEKRQERKESRRWKKTEHFSEVLPDEITAPELVKIVSDPKSKKPIIYSVAPEWIYKAGHIPGAVDIGPTSMDEGIENLKKTAANLTKETDIVIYCGCGHREQCPNINTSFDALTEMGFTHVKKLYLPYGFKPDWEDKKYPIEY